MRVYSVEFKNEQLKIAEEAVNSSLNLSNSLDMVSDQILTIAMQTKDETLQDDHSRLKWRTVNVLTEWLKTENRIQRRT